ncbi:MAG: lytic transglycosylase domain-containing protein [Bdellovibrionales bacterium]|nr:lytic transglycosylase domain-containing protein [Bdellovibrionales bacterium]
MKYTFYTGIVAALVQANAANAQVAGITEMPKTLPVSAPVAEQIEPNSKPTMNEYQIRLAHAKELLGKYFDKSIVGKSVKKNPAVAAYDTYIKDSFEKAFKKKHGGRFAKVAGEVAKTLVEESVRYGFDPLFLMAVIENESSFNPLVRGTSGEIGLMQILPDTAAWIAKNSGLPYAGAKTLEDPVQNIRLGAAYIAYLREKFDSHGQLYLAAYNMGSGNVKRYLASKTMPKVYPTRVMKRYVRFYTEISSRTL